MPLSTVRGFVAADETVELFSIKDDEGIPFVVKGITEALEDSFFIIGDEGAFCGVCEADVEGYVRLYEESEPLAEAEAGDSGAAAVGSLKAIFCPKISTFGPAELEGTLDVKACINEGRCGTAEKASRGMPAESVAGTEMDSDISASLLSS